MSPLNRVGGRVPIRDRGWRHEVLGVAVTDVVVPEPAMLAIRLAQLATRPGFERLNWEVTANGRRWRRRVLTSMAAAQLIQPAAALPDWTESTLGAFATDLAVRADLAWPIALIAGPNYLGVRISHLVADGEMVNRLVSGLLSDELPPPLPTPAPAPYLAALTRFVTRNPTALRHLGATRPPRRAARVAPPVAFTPSRHTLYARMPPESFAALRAWRKQHSRGSSTAALELALVCRALRAVGLTVDPDVTVLFDLRRYVGTSRRVDGNFAVGVDLAIDADTTPASITTLFHDVAASGRPLATMGAVLVAGLRPGEATAPAVAGSPAKLAFSAIGRPREVERLTRSGTGPISYFGSAEPSGPFGLTVIVDEIGGTPQLGATGHDTMLDMSLVRAALDLVTHDPIALLDRSLPAGPAQHALRATSR